MDVENSRGNNTSGNNNNNRRNKKRTVTRFGDEDFTLSTIDDYDEADWSEVFRTCCVRPAKQWLDALLGTLVVLFFGYFFLFSLVWFGDGAKTLSGCRAGEMFFEDEDAQEVVNPVMAAMMGVLATSMVQSSSTVTAIVVILVASGSLTVNHATYVIMGANVGTTITNDIVSLASFRNPYELERAFGASVVHDLINIFSLIILLPFEAMTGYLEQVTKLIVDGAETKRGEEWDGPIELWVKPLVYKIIRGNSGAIKKVAEGDSCDSFYPTECDTWEIQDMANNGTIHTYEECSASFIKCGKNGQCPAFYREGASLGQDQVAGGICVVLSLVCMYICIIGITTTVQYLVKGFSTRVVYKATNVNGYLDIAFGAGLTMILQSSSLTTSLLTPLASVGILRMEQMFALTLGANIGTTLSSIMVALLEPGLEPLQVALIHLFFNITAVLMWYPIPHMRQVILVPARKIGYCARIWPFFPVLYIVFVYFIIPIFMIALSNLYTTPSAGSLAGAIIITILLVVGVCGLVFFCKYRQGGTKTEEFVQNYLSPCNRGRNADNHNTTNVNDESSNFDDEQNNTNDNESDDDSSSEF